MVTPKCTQCGKVIHRDDVSVATDVAYCRSCNLAGSLSALAHGEAPPPPAGVDLSCPPDGAWCRSDGLWRIIGATHRSAGAAFGLLFMALFWNGIVSVFVLLAIAATLKNLGITVPEWFPAPVMNGTPMTVGVTIFLWIFLAPFILIGLAMLAGFISSLGGHTEVRFRSSEGKVFTGFGPLGWSRRFVPSAVRQVRVAGESEGLSDGRGRNKTSIIIETGEGKPLKFGSMLSEERREFVAAALRQELRNRR
jgi:hypothetical protein